MAYRRLGDEQAAHFLARGYVLLPQALPRDVVDAWAADAYPRLGIDPADPRTWTTARAHLPPSRTVEVRDFAPAVWEATCDVLGGEERIVEPHVWGDCFILNLAEGADRPWEAPAADTGELWHKDGGPHSLGAQDIGLLTLVAWTDVRHRGGGTFLAPDSIGVVARHLAAHPGGVEPGFGAAVIRECREFVELTARAGDVVLVHPFMLHSVSQNCLRVPRVISNHPTWLRDPLRFDREDPRAHSLVERAILAGLGRERFASAGALSCEAAPPSWILDARAAHAALRRAGTPVPAGGRPVPGAAG